ncbi:hypothetical protein U5922_010960 [Aquicoccus sp. G2-2]|uniref:hypothetical protein n=1 Tax=Aquicoccus sp. G2-2 TaxID=3092120 RepID=UPI002AE03985|nr:hypothetical protein [Aquicoccus sp. G2-2]MEA1113957.1 hypothetical protein [Aquicoccus sp. G2-2]
MSESRDINTLSDELAGKLGEKLGAKRGDFPARLAKAGRRLPRVVRRDAKVIDAALELGAHPKLRRRINQGEAQAAHRRIAAHLDRIDPKARRINFLLGMLGGLAFNLLLFAGLVLGVLKWRGVI